MSHEWTAHGERYEVADQDGTLLFRLLRESGREVRFVEVTEDHNRKLYLLLREFLALAGRVEERDAHVAALRRERDDLARVLTLSSEERDRRLRFLVQNDAQRESRARALKDRLSRLDDLLASEGVPEGLRGAVEEAVRDHSRSSPAQCPPPPEAAWRWFRKQLG